MFAFQDDALACVAEVLSNRELSGLPDELQQQLFNNASTLLSALSPAVRADKADVVVHAVQLMGHMLPAASIDIVTQVGIIRRDCRSIYPVERTNVD